MIWFELTLRLIGDLPYLETVRSSHEGVPFAVRPYDEPVSALMELRLAQGDFGDMDTRLDDATRVARASAQVQMAAATDRLRELTPTLKTLDPTRCHSNLVLSTGRTDSHAPFYYHLPSELIAAAGSAGLSLGISFLYTARPDSGEVDTSNE